MEITDEMVKKKHKEFNERIRNAIMGVQGGGDSVNPALERLGKTMKMKKPSLPIGLS